MVFFQRCRAGIWEAINGILRTNMRQQQRREKDPSVVIFDSRSVKTTEKGVPGGYDGGKQVKGRKRHIAVDVLGILILPTNFSDDDGAKARLHRLRFVPRWALFIFDGGYDKPP
jgi:hypothetical protein